MAQAARAATTTPRSPERGTAGRDQDKMERGQGWRILPRFLPSPTPCAS